ncbi:aspartyl protease family protein 2 [Quillaja saponaria]|uniref:Aspartyl protease family protein 2 n=1 Tax=Quillaja saponaria TaxID=32244 RepID=A0AAD7LU89_QUISA|nr:aspartyl protease family protein 2 [Quillaja saponaria]
MPPESISMDIKVSVILVLLLVFSQTFKAYDEVHNHNNHYSNDSTLTTGIEIPDHLSFNAGSSSPDIGCKIPTSKKGKTSEPTLRSISNGEEDGDAIVSATTKSDTQAVKLHLRSRSEAKKSVFDSTIRDLTRIQTLYRRITEKKNQNITARLQQERNQHKYHFKQVDAPAASPESHESGFPGQLMATLASGASLGSGEYFIDVFVGTPPKHFSLILDTGSDLNWIQCVPCYDCFEQEGPHYDPKHSSSFRNISCHDPRCQLVSSPDPSRPCKAENQTCPYYYWYGDSSNTTGDFAVETFTVNLSTSTGWKQELKQAKNVMFGCGHWNRGLFHGAAGLLGLGRGPLSFSSQLQSLYGHSFSYCLVDRDSDTTVSSKLIFGEDKDLLNHPNLNFTSFIAGKENPADTFYYVQIKSIMVGEKVVNIPEEIWKFTPEGAGGTIIDSGTTLTYFADPAYQIIKKAFMKEIKGYAVVKNPVLDLCYNVTGIEEMHLPEFGIVFADGGVWNFPVENYFFQFKPDDVICLAIMKTPHSPLSIIGNYLQQNFHVLYDIKKSRLGYAPMRCADV